MELARFHGGSEVKASASNVGDPSSIPEFAPWVGKIPWRRKWQPTPVFLPGESHGRRSLVGYSPRCCKESDMTERLHLHTKLMLNLEIFFIIYIAISININNDNSATCKNDMKKFCDHHSKFRKQCLSVTQNNPNY